MADETREKRPYTRRTTVDNVEQPEKKEEKTFTEADVQRMVAEAVAKAMASAQQSQHTQPQTIIVKDKEEMVTLLYMGVVAEGSMIPLGKLGEIQGRGGTRDIPKKEFFQNLTQPILKRLKDRRLIVLDGLTESEKERYGVKYTDDELLSADIYYKLLMMSEDEVANIFKKACYRHKQIIATLYIDAYMQGDNRINQPFIQRLNEISKAEDKEGMFKPILKDMVAALNEEADGE